MLTADAKSLKQMGTALRKAQPAVYRELRKALLVEAEQIRQRAASNASWSTRIPSTGKTALDGPAGVKVAFGGTAAPHAKPIEHAGASGFFRHPVMGNRGVWVDQPARPFLHPAALDHLQESAEAVGTALTVLVEKHLHGQDVLV